MATEFVGIELQLRGEEGVKADLQQIDKLLHSLGGRKKVDAGLQQLKRDIVAARGELEKYQRLRQSYKDAGGKGDAFVKEIQDARYHLRDLQQVQREVTLANRQMGKTFQQTFNSMSSRIAHAGSAMQSLGNAMVRLTSPFTRLATGMLYGAGFSAINKLTSGLSQGFTRYDTMKKYPKVMQAFGYSAEQAQKSIDRLDMSVRGLPTGLDEIVDMSQRFTATTGDIKKGTDLAIAANNAFLASMSTDTQKYQGMMQLQDVLGGKDMNAREWNSLVSSMTPAIVKMGESLGYTKDNMNEWITAVRSGQVDNEKFIDTLIKVGKEGGVVAKMAENSKDTWQAFFANVGNAASRMTAGIIKAFDEMANQLYGKDLNLVFAENIIPAIDKTTESIKNWIKANPDKILDFVNKLKSIDFKGFATGIVKGLGEMANILSTLASIAGNKGLEGFGKWMIRLNMMGKGLLVFGGVLKGLRAPLAFLGTLANWGAKGGLLGRLADLIGVGGAGSTAMKTADALDDAVPMLGRVSTGLTKFFKGWAQVAAMVGGSALVAWGSMKAFKGAFKDLKEISKIVSSINWYQAVPALEGMGIWIATLTGLGNMLGTGAVEGAAIGGLATILASGAFWADMEIIKQGLLAFKEATKLITESMDNLAEVGTLTGKQGMLTKINDAVNFFNQVTELLEPKRLRKGEETGNMELLGRKSANSIKNLSESIIGIRDTVKALDEIPPVEDIEGKAKKVEEAVSAMQGIYDKLMNPDTTEGTDISKGSNKYQRANAEGIISSVSAIIGTVRQTVADLEALQDLKVEIDTAKQNVIEIGKAMGEIFRSLNTAFGQMVTTDSEAGNWKKVENVGVTDTQQKSASKLASLFSSYMQTINSIKQIYQALVGGEGDTSFDLSAFQDAMNKLTGDEGIIPQLKSMYDQLVSEQEGFGSESDVDLSGIMESFSSAIGSIKQAVTTLSEIGQIDFGEAGMSGIVSQITSVITELTNAFNPELIAGMQAQVQAFVDQINQLKATIESLGEGGINVAIEITHEITGDTETVDALNTAHDNIKTARDAIKKLSGAINLSFPISVSITGVAEAVAKMNAAASKLRAARNNLRSASGGVNVHTGGYIGSRGVQYRALGGSIFKKRGSDTVPAMLTPGEYVQNRRAVDFFGIDFMRKVNQLDVRGAMSELMARAGHMAGASRGTVVNNTYNNNQKVVINGADVSNAGYTFKKASRFVGAL